MRRRNLSDEELTRVVNLKQVGASWVKIQRETGINRRTAKRTYEKWQRSKSLEELKEARKDVAAQAFREHMDSLVALATFLVNNLSAASSLGDMKISAEEFLSRLWKQDVPGRENYFSSEGIHVYTVGGTQRIYAGDKQFSVRTRELLFESLREHTREGVRWEDVLDNRWKLAWDNCAKVLVRLRKETSEVVNNYISLERQTNLLHSIKEGSRETDPAKRMAEAVLKAIWKGIPKNKLTPECLWFETALSGDGRTHAVYLRPINELVLRLADESLAKKVISVCKMATNNLCKGDTVRQLHDEVGKMEKAGEELREMLNPVKLVPMILRTRCDLCPA